MWHRRLGGGQVFVWATAHLHYLIEKIIVKSVKTMQLLLSSFIILEINLGPDEITKIT